MKRTMMLFSFMALSIIGCGQTEKEVQRQIEKGYADLKNEFRMSALLAKGKGVDRPSILGEYRTFVKGISSVDDKGTITSTGPSSFPHGPLGDYIPTKEKGMRIEGKAFKEGGTPGQPNRWEIYVGKYKQVRFEFYPAEDATAPLPGENPKPTIVSIEASPRFITPDTYAGLETTYNPETGIVIVDTVSQSPNVNHRYVGYGYPSDGARAQYQTNCYFDVIVSESVSKK